MSETAREDEAHAPEPGDEAFALNPDFVRSVVDALDTGNVEAVRDLVEPLHVADLADLLGLLAGDQRRRLLEALGTRLDPDVLPELDETLLDEIVRSLEPSILAASVAALDSDDAIYVLESLEEEHKQQVLGLMPTGDRAAMEKGLAYPEDSAGRLMQTEVISVPPFWTVGQTIDYMRENRDLPDEFYEIFIVDPAHHPIGTVPLNRVLRTRRPVRMSEIMTKEITTIPVSMDQEEVAFLFEQYSLVSAAVVDGDDRLAGVITVDDVVEVIQEEAEEDILRLGGVGDEGMTDTVITTTRRRFSWLLVNLATAILASIVIAYFESTIQEVVALAVLMPIVASMGGNAGTQTLTIAVRAIATRDLTAANAARIILREVFVGGINGVTFAVLMGIIGAVWFSQPLIGAVIALAMVINLLVAGLAGILVPLTLVRLRVDPAIASTVFVTTVTDVVGFFAFLGLGALLLL